MTVHQWLDYKSDPSRIDHRTTSASWHNSWTCRRGWCGATREDATRGRVLPPTEGEHHDAGAVADDRAAEPHRLEVPDSPAAGTAPASPDPLTEAEYDAIVGTIWNELDGDPHRFDELLAEALGFIAGIALMRVPTDAFEADRATAALRAFEQRALWGPTDDQENHR